MRAVLPASILLGSLLALLLVRLVLRRMPRLVVRLSRRLGQLLVIVRQFGLKAKFKARLEV